MAKMFYSLEETAEKLGLAEDQIKQMVDDGKLQQFRDRDQLMFKVDQVDKLAASQSAANDESGEINVDEAIGASEEPQASSGSGLIGVSDDTGEIDLGDTNVGVGDGPEASGSGGGSKEAEESEALDLGSGTGIDLGDSGADEKSGASGTSSGLDLLADETGQGTQLGDKSGGAAEGADAMGSGSGLLDLTQESDDTSLGSVELVDDAPSDAGVESDAKMGEGSDALAGSSTGIFEAAGGAESSQSFDAGAEPMAEDDDDLAAMTYASEDTGEGFNAGMLAGVVAVLLVGLLVAVPAVRGVAPTGLTVTLAEGDYGMWYIVLAVVCLVFGVVGMMVSKR